MRSRHAVAAAAGLLLANTHLGAADAVRGGALYELRCLDCHSDSVHGRVKRTAKDFGEVRGWVARWNTSLSLRWTAEEVEDVTVYLNARYYGYRCPPSACPVISLARLPGPGAAPSNDR